MKFLISCSFFLLFLEISHGASGDFWYTPMKPPVPSAGVPWPLPQTLTFGADNLTVDPNELEMKTETTCELVLDAIQRYRGILLLEKGKNKNRFQQDNSKSDKNLTQLEVNLSGKCEKYPYLGMDEKYRLIIYENGTGVLNSNSVWGILRGLETFSQLTFLKSIGDLRIRTAYIEDWPRFSHRGLLLDTSRHYLSISVIKKNLDLMAFAKYNVFHWHIVDDQSFPYVSDFNPNMSQKGAYTTTHVYTKKDIQDVVEYARNRGIRVMPEFDTPGHVLSWGKGEPSILTRCYDEGKYTEDYGVVDPSLNSTYDFLLKLFKEVLSRYPDDFIHLGGDEVFFDCWQSNMGIEELMKQLNIQKSNISKLEDYYLTNLLALIEKARQNVKYVVWQEVFDNGVQLKPDAVVHVWMGNNQDEIDEEISKVTKGNFNTILSSCWYLNYVKYGNNWEDYYKCDPQHFNGTPQQKALVIGGETCMWGEWIDNTNVLPTLWPRASVVAERLWSDASVTDTSKATPRLEEHRCRLVRRGYPAAPVNGPGYCLVEFEY